MVFFPVSLRINTICLIFSDLRIPMLSRSLTKRMAEVAVLALALIRIAALLAPSPAASAAPIPTAHPGRLLGHHPTTTGHRPQSHAATTTAASCHPRSSARTVAAAVAAVVAAAAAAASASGVYCSTRRVRIPAILAVTVNAKATGHRSASAHSFLSCGFLWQVWVVGARLPVSLSLSSLSPTFWWVEGARPNARTPAPIFIEVPGAIILLFAKHEEAFALACF